MSFSSSSSYSGGSSSFNSFSGYSIRAPAPIVSLRAIHDNDTLLVNDISSMLTERNVDRLHDNYHISREIFQIYAPNPNVRIDDQILLKISS